MADQFTFTVEPIGSAAAPAEPWMQCAGTDGPFFTSWDWIGTWLATLPPSAKPLLLSARSGARTVGLALLFARDTVRRSVVAARQMHFNSTGDPELDCLTIEHNGFAAAEIDKAALNRAFLAWFAAGGLGCDELVMGGFAAAPDSDLPADGPLLHSVEPVEAYRLDLATIGPGSDPWANLSRNSRQQLRRALRACAASGPLAIEEASSVDQALAYFEAMKPLHIASWERRGRPHSFSRPYFETYHRALIAAGTASGATQMLKIRAGDEVLGYLYNFRRAGTVSAYQSGFGASDNRRVGYVCHALAIEQSARRGDKTYDFLAGTNQLKQSLASQVYRMDWHVFQRPLLRFRLENAARSLKRRFISN